MNAQALTRTDPSHIDSGVGVVHERTIELGARVLWLENIGSIRIIDGQRSYLFMILGALAALGGLMMLRDSVVSALALLGLAGALIYINLNQKVIGGLSIGTCDGRSTFIVSSDREFLGGMLDLLRRKIDTENIALLAQFNIANGEINTDGGGVVVGRGGVAGAARAPVPAIAVEPRQPLPPPPPRPPAPEGQTLQPPPPPPPRLERAPPPEPPPIPPRAQIQEQYRAARLDMPDYDRLEPSRGGGAGRWVALAIGLIILAGGAAGAYWWWTQQQQVTAAAPEVAPEAPAEAPPVLTAYVGPTLTPSFDGVSVLNAPGPGTVILSRVNEGDALTITGRTTVDGEDYFALQLAGGQIGYVRAADLIPTQEWRDAQAAAETTARTPPLAEPAGPLPGAEEVKPIESFSIDEPVWISRPTAGDYARAYPPRALQRGRSGNVLLDCVVDGGGGLACTVASETPPGQGFGNAALQLSRHFRMQRNLPDGRPVAGGRIRLPITFRTR